MRLVRFNWPWYLPGHARRTVTLAVVIVVVILTVAFISGYGKAALAALGVALLGAVVTEGVRTVLQIGRAHV